VENVAHALAGLLVAEAAIAVHGRGQSEPPGRGFARLALVTSAVANNIPDADIVYTGITGGKLGYLLHHRGHTHTLLVGVLLGAAVALASIGWAKWRGPELARRDRLYLLALGGFGPVLHVLMDAWNVYGVHPLWPLYSGWFYGDAVFIVEPLLWVTAIPPLWLAAKSRVWRVVLGLLLAAGIGLPWLAAGLVPLPARLALLATAMIVGALAWRMTARARILLGLVAFSAIPVLFLATGALARRRVLATLEATFPDAATHDVALTPLAANPLCWYALSVQTTPAGELAVRASTHALLATAIAVDACPRRSSTTTAPLVAVRAAGDAATRWDGEYVAPLRRLQELARDHCEISALMRFVRVPFHVDRGASIVVGDHRFDREESLGFGEIEVEAQPSRCPQNVPPWRPPRADLLGVAE
jgi:inner membrane protein